MSESKPVYASTNFSTLVSLNLRNRPIIYAYYTLMHPYIINKSTLTRCQIILSTSLSIDDVAFINAVLGPGALVAKYDAKSAFRLILIAPSNFDQLGFKFQEKYYFDKSVAMLGFNQLRNLRKVRYFTPLDKPI